MRYARYPQDCVPFHRKNGDKPSEYPVFRQTHFELPCRRFGMCQLLEKHQKLCLKLLTLKVNLECGPPKMEDNKNHTDDGGALLLRNCQALSSVSSIAPIWSSGIVWRYPWAPRRTHGAGTKPAQRGSRVSWKIQRQISWTLRCYVSRVKIVS